MNCNFIKKNNEQCKGFAIHGSDYCFVHSPEAHDKHNLAVKKGGSCSYKDKLELAEAIDLTSTKNLLTLLQDTINRIRVLNPNGSIDLRTANSIGFLSSKIVEVKKIILEELADNGIEEIEEFRRWKHNQEKFDRLFDENPDKAIHDIIEANKELENIQESNLNFKQINAKPRATNQHPATA
jgi:hypothetical protein